MSWHNRNRDLIALALAGILLVALQFGLRLHPLYAVVISVAVWLGIWLALAPSRSDGEKKSANGADIAHDEHPSAADMNEARRTWLELEALHAELLASRAPLAVLDPVESILSASQSMLEEADSRPEDFRYDRRALLHFLPQVVGLLDQYKEGLQVPAESDATQQRLHATLLRLAELFSVFRKRKADRATRALNVQIDVLEAQLLQEGLAPNGPKKD